MLDAGEPQLSGKEYKIFATIKEGISQDTAKKVSKIIRDEGPKGVQVQIQGEQLRVTSKKRDDSVGRHRSAQGKPSSTSRCKSSSTTAEMERIAAALAAQHREPSELLGGLTDSQWAALGLDARGGACGRRAAPRPDR